MNNHTNYAMRAEFEEWCRLREYPLYSYGGRIYDDKIRNMWEGYQAASKLITAQLSQAQEENACLSAEVKVLTDIKEAFEHAFADEAAVALENVRMKARIIDRISYHHNKLEDDEDFHCACSGTIKIEMENLLKGII